jgi:iron complex transport system substrate-binding protein
MARKSLCFAVSLMVFMAICMTACGKNVSMPSPSQNLSSNLTDAASGDGSQSGDAASGNGSQSGNASDTSAAGSSGSGTQSANSSDTFAASPSGGTQSDFGTQSGNTSADSATSGSLPLTLKGHMELAYAEKFSVDYYEGGFSLITIADDSFLLVPEGQKAPEGIAIPCLMQPISSIYVASSSAMDLFLHCGAMQEVAMTSTAAADWTVPEIHDAVSDGSITYVGKYHSPDYETILTKDCGLVVENTMIYHSPETKEMLEALGVPVMVEWSSYEPHPLGRVEWIKLYGLLTGHEEEAEAFFSKSLKTLDTVLSAGDSLNTAAESAGRKTVTFFYITTSGYANVRKSGDYISKMIALAGGEYFYPGGSSDSENSLSTLNMDLETFYTTSKNADIQIYNSTVDTELTSIDDLIKKSPLLEDFKAVKTGDVWCTNQNMFQQISGTADMIAEMYSVIHDDGDVGTRGDLVYLHKLS